VVILSISALADIVETTIPAMWSVTLSFHAILLVRVSSNIPPKDENYANMEGSVEYRLVSLHCSLLLAALNKPSS